MKAGKWYRVIAIWMRRALHKDTNIVDSQFNRTELIFFAGKAPMIAVAVNCPFDNCVGDFYGHLIHLLNDIICELERCCLLILRTPH